MILVGIAAAVAGDVACCGAQTSMEPAKQFAKLSADQKNAIAEIRRLGGSVSIYDETPDGPRFSVFFSWVADADAFLV